MNTYRPRLAELRAVDCGDGRYLLITEPPRYVPSSEFEAAFELVAEQRQVNGRKPKARIERPEKGRRRAAAVAQHPKLEEAQRLFEKDGLELPAIVQRTGVKYQTLYGWSKRYKWKQGAKKKADPSAPSRASTTRAAKPPAIEPAHQDGGWMK